MIDFLIFYEVVPRELESIVLLGNELKSHGYSVEYLSFERVNTKKYIGNKKYIDKYFGNVKVAIMPSLYHDTELYHIVYYVCGKCCQVVNLRWEQSFTVKDEMNYDNYNYPHGDAKKAFHLCWGKANYDNLKNSGVKEENLILSGPLQMDFLRPQFNGYFFDKKKLFEKYEISLEKKSVLYISSFAISSMTERQIELDEANAGQSLYRDRINFTRESQKHSLEWIEALLHQNNCNFIYRPHPVENVLDELKELERKYNNFKVISDFSVKQWILSCDIIVTWMSTSIAEIFFSGKSCILARPLPFAPENEVTVLKGAKAIDNEEDFIKSVENGNTMSVSQEVIREYYNVTDTPSYLRLADKLFQIYSSDKLFEWDDKKADAFDRQRKKYAVLSIIISVYIVVINLIGIIREKTGFSFGKKINGRADSYRKAKNAIATKLASEEKINATSEKIAGFCKKD